MRDDDPEYWELKNEGKEEHDRMLNNLTEPWNRWLDDDEESIAPAKEEEEDDCE